VFSVLLGIACIYMIYIVKPYIIFAMFPGLMIWFFLSSTRNIADIRIKVFIGMIMLGVGLAVSYFFFTRLSNVDDGSVASRYSADNLLGEINKQQESYAYFQKNIQVGSGSYFSTGEIPTSIGGVLLSFPVALATSLFRPFIFEVRNPLMLFSALESTFYLFLTLLVFYRVGFRRIGKIIAGNPVIIFSLLFSVVFMGLVAVSTLNFGTLARYKAPGMPFYLLFLFLTIEDARKKYKLRFVFPKPIAFLNVR
jgi:hypothetical protein